MRVLAVDDDIVSAELLKHTLTEYGYEVTLANNGQEALALIRTGLYRLVVSDWEMPCMSGVDLCREIRRRTSSGYTYVILLTSNCGTQSVVEGLSAGADDFISKPFHPEELQVRLRVGERVLSLESRDLIIFSLAKLAESRDIETGTHLERMREYSRILADELTSRDLPEKPDGQYVQLIHLTSPLHDIGKVGIPDRVLLKPGRLTNDEFEIMKQHTVIGGQTLDAAAGVRPDTDFLQIARDIAWTHHEWYNGEGYPRGLKGDGIPLCGRIVTLADVYDALTTKRVYKDAFSHETAKATIVSRCGEQFDPSVVQAFLARERDFIKILQRFGANPNCPTPASEPQSELVLSVV
jgi:putative two-component system response regulator